MREIRSRITGKMLAKCDEQGVYLYSKLAKREEFFSWEELFAQHDQETDEHDVPITAYAPSTQAYART